jgi:hypothetical protein
MQSVPFALPEKLDRELAAVQSYWEGLKRGGNTMPFWDDLKLAALDGEGARLLLIDAFEQPERFRFNFLSDGLKGAGNLKGDFLDTAALPHPFEFMRAQCSATVEGRAPTYYRNAGSDGAPGYSRLLLPMWGDGRIGMLLGAIAGA